MGVWGEGNFDDDTAADYLSVLTRRLVEELAAAMDNKNVEPDEYWGVAVPCIAELLNLIARQKWVGTMIPKPAVVDKWKRDYMSVWDGYIDQLDPNPELNERRRAVLVRTFDELLFHSIRNDDDHDDQIARLGGASEPEAREIVARAMNGKATEASRNSQGEEAIAIYDEIVARFGDASEIALRDQVALALSDKAYRLAELGRLDEAIAACDAVVTRFGEALETVLQQRVAAAVFTKGYQLDQFGRRQEAMTVYRDVIARFRTVDDPSIRHIVKRAEQLLNAPE
jgi:tetratricopeptide (TPR) repeat protein